MLSALLAEREKKGKPIKVGIIGTGKFGGGLVTQIARMKGMTVSAIADIKPENARYAVELAEAREHLPIQERARRTQPPAPPPFTGEGRRLDE